MLYVNSFNFLLQVTDWPLPAKCSSNQVKIGVEYCGINFADVYHVFGRLMDKPAPYVLGLECVGEITELGTEVKGFKVRDFKPREYNELSATIKIKPGKIIVKLF